MSNPCSKHRDQPSCIQDPNKCRWVPGLGYTVKYRHMPLPGQCKPVNENSIDDLPKDLNDDMDVDRQAKRKKWMDDFDNRNRPDNILIEKHTAQISRDLGEKLRSIDNEPEHRWRPVEPQPDKMDKSWRDDPSKHMHVNEDLSTVLVEKIKNPKEERRERMGKIIQKHTDQKVVEIQQKWDMTKKLIEEKRKAAAREAAARDPNGKRKRQEFGRTVMKSDHKKTLWSDQY